MRPRRLPQYPQYPRQTQQEEENRSYLNYSEYSPTWDENSLASGTSLRFTRGRCHDSYSNNEWRNDYTDVPRHRRYRSERYVADISSGYSDSSSRWTGYRNYQEWDTTYGARAHGYRDDVVSPSYNNRHNDTNRYDDGFRSSEDRHHVGTHNHYNRYNSSRTRNYRQQRRPYHSSVAADNSSPTSTHDANDVVAVGTSTEGFSGSLIGHHDSQRSAHQVTPSHIPMERNLSPSEEYLKISAEKSETLGGAMKADVDVEGLVRKLLVLDLNGTLVYRSPHRSWRDRHPGRNGGGIEMTQEDVYAQFDPSQPRPLRTAHPRPYLTPFRNYLFHPSTKRWLDTMIWSSAQPHNVNDMVERCFGDKKGELIAIWARDRLGLAASDYGRKVQTTKDLNKPWSELNSFPLVAENTSTSSESEKPVLQRDHSAKTTLLLDDSPLKAHLQPYNHLCLKEYDLEMRKHDMSVRELEVAREKLADVLSGKQTIEEVLQIDNDHDLAKELQQEDVAPSADAEDTLELEPETRDGDSRKRKRKEKKENKKKERIEQQVQKLKEQGTPVYDETLLAVIGILDATKRETNVAAWIRSGGLIQSLVEPDYGEIKRVSDVSEEAVERPKKRLKVSQESEEGKQSLEKDTVSSVGSDQVPLPTSLPLRETLPPREDDRSAESETERTGIPVDEPSSGEGAEGTKDVQNQLWFDNPGTEAFWASKGRKVLEELEIDVVPGVIRPTG